MERSSEQWPTPRHVVPAPAGLSRGAPAPWWLKLGLKLGLAAVGLHGARARAIGIARPSYGMNDTDSILAPRGWLEQATRMMGRPPMSLLELGPGGMTIRAPILAGLDLAQSWFLDIEDSGPRNLEPFLKAAALARTQGIAAPDLSACGDRASIFTACNTTLLIGGPDVLSAIPDKSIDLVVSVAMLEHVRRDLLASLLAQLRRVTAPDGIGMHAIDFQDHLGGGLNHLRFSDAFWASPLVGRAGVYVNRLGLSAMVSSFDKAGFEVDVPDGIVWQQRPAGPAKPHPDVNRPASDDLVARAMLTMKTKADLL